MQRRDRCAIGVMAKAPQPGRVKTRLSPPLTSDEASALGAAFLRDVTENIQCAARTAPIDGYVAYAPSGSESLFDGHLADCTSLMLADGSPISSPGVTGFGRCLLHAIRAMLEEGYAAACVLNSDSPTLPTELLCQAANALLQSDERVVLGPAEDGGYYLLGMRAPHTHLFENIAWSTATVAMTTRERVHALDLELVELPSWYDVDDHRSLRRLLEETALTVASALAPYPAPITAACIDRLGLRTQPTVEAAE